MQCWGYGSSHVRTKRQIDAGPTRRSAPTNGNWMFERFLSLVSCPLSLATALAVASLVPCPLPLVPCLLSLAPCPLPIVSCPLSLVPCLLSLATALAVASLVPCPFRPLKQTGLPPYRSRPVSYQQLPSDGHCSSISRSKYTSAYSPVEV